MIAREYFEFTFSRTPRKKTLRSRGIQSAHLAATSVGCYKNHAKFLSVRLPSAHKISPYLQAGNGGQLINIFINCGQKC